MHPPFHWMGALPVCVSEAKLELRGTNDPVTLVLISGCFKSSTDTPLHPQKKRGEEGEERKKRRKRRNIHCSDGCREGQLASRESPDCKATCYSEV